jgi:heterodisulfide reductase subunit C
MAPETFAQEVTARSGQNISLCYQCYKCGAGCTVSRYAEYRPNSIIRLIQYGKKEEVLKSHMIWLCVSCMTCGVRCPNNIDMSAVMDTLREMSQEAGFQYQAERTVVILHQEFVRNVSMWGRLHEVTFFIPHMVRSLDLFGNLVQGLLLIMRNKLPFIPKQIKSIDEIWRLYKNGYKTKKELLKA